MIRRCDADDTAMANVEGRAEHLRLAGIVKGLHADLRKKFKKCKDADEFEEIWKEHCKDADTLRQYAEAMHHLAKDHWTRLPETRIDWCRKTILEYFHGDGLKKALEKVGRRTKVHQMRKFQNKCLDQKKIDSFENKQIDGTEGHNSEKGVLCPDKATCDLEEVDAENICKSETDPPPMISTDIVVPLKGRIHLLDVGSCYNPFGAFDEFLAIGLDISPANSMVHRCDFINLTLTNSDPGVGLSKEDPFGNLPDSVTELPRQSFQVVVFSLLLEYLPSASQRWTCCFNAHQLLAGNGLLVIVTPDSHKQHRNAAMIKSWRHAVESIGFARWRYVKLDHLHCLAFRKLQVGEVRDKLVGPASPDMLYIPQDFHDDEEEEEEGGATCHTDVENEDISKTFEELPTCFGSDDSD